MARGARLRVFEPLFWWRHQKSWRLGPKAVAGLSFVVAVSIFLCVIVAFPLASLRHYRESMLSTPAAAWLVVDAVTAAATYGYIYVGSRAERSPQLHAHGFVLFVMHLSILGVVAKNALELAEACVWHVVSQSLMFVAWGSYKTTMFVLIGEKMAALGPPADCCLDAGTWAKATALSAAAASAAGVGACTWAAGNILDGMSCEEFYEKFDAGAFQADAPLAQLICLGSLVGVASLSACVLLVAGSGMMRAAVRLRRRTISKLARRQVPREVLATVRRMVGQHVLGVVTCTVSAQLVVAGDISGHIRGLLHSAVLEGRAEIVFEGSMASTPANFCVVSFPGKYMRDWQSLTWACEQGDMSSACVFLPRADAEGRFGRHPARPGGDGECWCHSIYGEEKPWGCAWFPAWQSNVHRAVELKLELVVVFFPGQIGQGVVHWADLGRSSLWDGVGLGGSQKCEVAYLKKCGYPVTELDLEGFRCRVSRGSRARPL